MFIPSDDTLRSLDKAIRVNPYNPDDGNESAYVRYLRYNVEGFHGLDSEVVRRLWKSRISGDREKGNTH